MCAHFDFSVETLKRVRIMDVSLDKLAVGKWRHLSEVEVARIFELVRDSSKT
jgi:23S rRNA pseudouridine2604 synthase